jgi:SCP-2 sterol transfer family
VSAYAKLKKMIDLPRESGVLKQNDVDASMESLAQHLARAIGKDVGRVAVNVYDKNHISHYCLDLIGDECRISKQLAEDSRFGISVTKETWAEIASGELAPMDAFLMGRMALSGEISFGRRLYAKLAEKNEESDNELV